MNNTLLARENPSLATEAWKCVGIFLAITLGVLLYLSIYMFRSIDPTDSSMIIFSQQLAIDGMIFTKMTFFSDLFGSLWLRIAPTPNLWGWASLGGAILLALSAGVGSLIIRKILRPDARVLIFSYLAAFIAIPVIKIDFIINYYTFPLLLAMLYLLLLSYAVERWRSIWLWLLLGILGGLFGFCRIPAVSLNVLPLVYLLIYWCYAKAKKLPGIGFPWRAAAIYLVGFVMASVAVFYTYHRYGFFDDTIVRAGIRHKVFEVLGLYIKQLIERNALSIPLLIYGWFIIFIFKNKKIQIVGMLLPIVLVIICWTLLLYLRAGEDFPPFSYHLPYWKWIRKLNNLIFILLIMTLIPRKIVDFFGGGDDRKIILGKCLIFTVIVAALLFPLGSDTGSWKLYYFMPLIFGFMFVLLIDYWRRDRQKLFVFGLIGGLVINGAISMFFFSYRDGLPHRMNRNFESAQLSWMKSTPERVELYDRIISVLSHHLNPGDTFQDFGNNYIFNSVFNARPTLLGWNQWMQMSEFLLDDATAPDFIFFFNPESDHYQYDEVADKERLLPILKTEIFPGRYVKVVDDPEFEIYEKASRSRHREP